MNDLITQLNMLDEHIQYSLDTPTTITGRWKFEGDARGMLGEESLELEHSVTATIDSVNKKFVLKEKQAQSGVKLSVGLNGISLGGQFGGFMGSTGMTKKTGTTIKLFGKPGEDRFRYDLDINRIKKPLIESLENMGYKKKGFFG